MAIKPINEMVPYNNTAQPELTHDALYQIFSMTIKDLGACLQVKKTWNALSSEQGLWECFIFAHFPPNININVSTYWNKFVKKSHLKQRIELAQLGVELSDWGKYAYQNSMKSDHKTRFSALPNELIDGVCQQLIKIVYIDQIKSVYGYDDAEIAQMINKDMVKDDLLGEREHNPCKNNDRARAIQWFLYHS